MVLEKLPDHTLLDNECVKNSKPMLPEHICHNFSGRPTSAPEVPYYSIEHLQDMLYESLLCAAARRNARESGRRLLEKPRNHQKINFHIFQNLSFVRPSVKSLSYKISIHFKPSSLKPALQDLL